MKIGCRLLFSVVWVMAAFIGCQQHANNGKLPESKEAKQLLQGVWSDVESESVVFQIHGDSVYYPDSTSMPAYFRVYNDTLYIGSSSRYHIEKHSEHVLWFKGGDGEIVKLVKENDTQEEELFEKQKTQILTLSDVMKNDTVVVYQNNRYHLYIAVNPFFDLGIVTQPYNLDDLVERHTNGLYKTLQESVTAAGEVYSDYFTTDSKDIYRPHMTAGLGLKIGMNENFVLSADWGMPIDKQDNQKWANFYVKMGYLF